MSTENIRVLVRYRLLKADGTLLAAQLLLTQISLRTLDADYKEFGGSIANSLLNEVERPIIAV